MKNIGKRIVLTKISDASIATKSDIRVFVAEQNIKYTK